MRFVRRPAVHLARSAAAAVQAAERANSCLHGEQSNLLRDRRSKTGRLRALGVQAIERLACLGTCGTGRGTVCDWEAQAGLRAGKRPAGRVHIVVLWRGRSTSLQRGARARHAQVYTATPLASSLTGQREPILRLVSD